MKVNVSQNQFCDLVVSFLLDKVMNPESVVPDNELFNEFIDGLKKGGLRPKAVSYYMEMGAEMRVKYKLLKPVLIGKTEQSQIYIKYEEPEEKPEKKTNIMTKIAAVAAGAAIATKVLKGK